MAQFARDMRLPDGPHQGDPWLPETEPAQALWLAEHDSGRWRHFVDVAPSQRGKTLKTILCPALHGLTEHRQSVAYVMPNLDKLAQNWEGKIKPGIEGAGFGAWLPTKGPGSKGGKPAALSFRDPATGLVASRFYFMAMGHGGRETSLSSVSVARIVIDEADDAESAGQLQLALKRLESFAFGRSYIASTVNDRGGRSDHPILELYQASSASRITQRCPHCTGYQVLEWDQVDLSTVQVACRLCAATWSPGDRIAALNAARLVHRGQTVTPDGIVCGEPPAGESFGLLTTCLDYHMGSLPAMVAEFIQAQDAAGRGDHSLAKTFAHKRLCGDYVIDQMQTVDVSANLICKLSASSSYQAGEVPAPVEFLTVGVDCQERWHYWKLIGARADGTFYHIAAGIENLHDQSGRALENNQPATDAARWNCMDRISREVSRWSNIEGKPIVRRMVDVGYATEVLRGWLAKRPEWTAVVGRAESQIWRQKMNHQGNRVEGGYLSGVADIRRQTDALGVWMMWMLDVDAIRSRIHDGYLLPREDAGAGHLPRGIELRSRDLGIKVDSPMGWWARHLSAEIRKVDPLSGQVEWMKRDGGGRHDLLDSTVYAYGGALAHIAYIQQQAPPAIPKPTNYTATSIPRDYAETSQMPKQPQSGKQFYQRKFSISRSRR